MINIVYFLFLAYIPEIPLSPILLHLFQLDHSLTIT